MNIQELDDIRVISKFFEEHNFPECSLGVCSVPEGIKYFLDGHHRPTSPVSRFPDNAVSSLTEPSPDLVLLPDMRINVRGGLIV